MRGSRHSDETRAAVMAALLSGQSVSTVARTYNLSTSVICGIKKEIGSSKFEQIREKKHDEFGTLVAEFLRETLVTLKVQMEFVRTESWLKQQEAAQLATLIGVTTDKAIRLLEAAQAAGVDQELQEVQPEPS